MKTHHAVFALSAYMLIMALLGVVRTGSVIPLVILGSVAVVTFGLGLGVRRGSRNAMQFTLAWLAFNAVITGYEVFWRNPAHGQPRPGHALIFGSLALFSLVVLVLVWRRYRRMGSE